MSEPRDRQQLVIALGQGKRGRARRRVLDKAAKASGKTVSAWARDILLAAACKVPDDARPDWGLPQGQPTKTNDEELELLEKRLDSLERSLTTKISTVQQEVRELSIELRLTRS